MNPFYYINELKQTLETKKNDVAGTPARISTEQHYQEMINMLQLLETEMQEAEYNYQVVATDFTVRTFDELTVLQKDLNNEVIIFQPVATDEELSAIDMQSLADVLKQLRDNGKIKEDMLLLPPNINVFRAKLAQPNTEEEEL